MMKKTKNNGYYQKVQYQKWGNITQTKQNLKSDVLLLACVFEKFIKVSVNEFGFNPLHCVNLPGHTWQCGLKFTGIHLQTLRDKD